MDSNKLRVHTSSPMTERSLPLAAECKAIFCDDDLKLGGLGLFLRNVT